MAESRLEEVITDCNGNAANPADCDYSYGELTALDGSVVKYRNCRTHGHGSIIETIPSFENEARAIVAQGGQLLLDYDAGDCAVTFTSRRYLVELIRKALRKAHGR